MIFVAYEDKEKVRVSGYLKQKGNMSGSVKAVPVREKDISALLHPAIP